MTRRVSLWCATAMAVMVAAGIASPASGQTMGLRAGASADPDQFYVGVHAETGHVADKIHFRPNVELGIGNDLTLVAANLEFIYRTPIQSSRWSVFVGGGPSANFYSYNRGAGRGDSTDVGGGLNVLLGLEHRDGLFTELKVGLIDSPSVKFGVGFSFGR